MTPHPFYGRRLLTQRMLNQREREASIKPTATIGMSKGLDEATGGKKRAVYLNDTRTVSQEKCASVPRWWVCSTPHPAFLRFPPEIESIQPSKSPPKQEQKHTTSQSVLDQSIVWSPPSLHVCPNPVHPQAFNDPMLLPGPVDSSVHVDEPSRLHAQHPAMLWRKLHERPFSELQGSRKHDENVYGSTLENFCPTAWNTLKVHEPLLPMQRHNAP